MRKCRYDYEFFLHKKKRKTPIFGTTAATSDFLVIVSQNNPEMTISELRELLTDRSKCIPSPEAIVCFDAYIKHGEGDVIPRWK